MLARYFLTIFLSFFISVSTILGQNEMDVLRYSTTDVFGSARFEAMAGSFGALGADLSSIQVNPAGIGRFSSSKMDLSINIGNISNRSIYNGTEFTSNANKNVIGNIGVVLTRDRSNNNNGWRYSQFTFAYNRLKNFASNRIYEGQNFHSLLDVFASDGEGIHPDYIYNERPFTTSLGYYTYALDFDPSTNEYYSLLTTGDMYHHREIANSGGMGEFHIGYSGNFMNMFYFGGSIGIRRVKYGEDIYHTEKLLDTIGTPLRSFNYYYDQKTRGTGINLKLGVLYLPSDEFRLGLSFESPTIMKLQDNWKADMDATFFDGNEIFPSESIPEGEFEYRIKTPLKLRGSVAYVFGMRGAINLDLELARLPGGKLNSYNTAEHPGNAYSFNLENDEIKNQFRTILNTRLGIEYMVFDGIYLRGGIALLPQPYKKRLENSNQLNYTYSGGIGWENNNFYLNLSYRILKTQEDYYAFDPSEIKNRVDFKTTSHFIVLSGGFNF